MSGAGQASRWVLALAFVFAHPHTGQATLKHAAVPSRTRARSTMPQHARRPDPSRVLGDTILAFALRAQGRQVGDGECFSLADRALSNAGAKSAAAYTELTPDGDYIWGNPIRLADARPGDILQFRGFRIVKRVTTTTRTADGGLYRTQTEQSDERDHHTAIVAENLGHALSILEQNVDPLGTVVQRNQIDIASGVISESNVAEGSQVTTQIFIDGQIWAYRPQRANVTYAALSPQS